jgi:hypothetical protein
MIMGYISKAKILLLILGVQSTGSKSDNGWGKNGQLVRRARTGLKTDLYVAAVSLLFESLYPPVVFLYH